MGNKKSTANLTVNDDAPFTLIPDRENYTYNINPYWSSATSVETEKHIKELNDHIVNRDKEIIVDEICRGLTKILTNKKTLKFVKNLNILDIHLAKHRSSVNMSMMYSITKYNKCNINWEVGDTGYLYLMYYPLIHLIKYPEIQSMVKSKMVNYTLTFQIYDSNVVLDDWPFTEDVPTHGVIVVNFTHNNHKQ